MPQTPTNLVKMREHAATQEKARVIEHEQKIKLATARKADIQKAIAIFAAKHNVPIESVHVIACTRKFVTLGA